MSIVTDFKSIKRKLNRMEQKADFEEKNPKVDIGMYGYPSNLTVPFSGVATGGAHGLLVLGADDLPAYTPSPIEAQPDGIVQVWPSHAMPYWKIKL